MIKNIAITTFFIVMSITTYEQDTIQISLNTKVPLKGVLVQKFNLKEIQFIRENKEIAKLGKSHYIPVDYEVIDFFVPSDSITHSSLSSIVLKTDRCYSDASYLMDTKDNISTINVFCGKFNYKVENDTKYCNSPFYTLGEDSLYLYKLKYIEGSSVYCSLENTRMNHRNLGLECRTNLDKDWINCYLFYKVDSTNCELNFDNFSIWE